MGSIPQKSWKIDGCKGSFFLRGKNNIIWYRRSRNERFSTGLKYTPKNRIIAARKIEEEEGRGLINTDIKTIGQALDYFVNSTRHKKTKSTHNTYNVTFGIIFPDHNVLINDFKYIHQRLEDLKNSDRSNSTIYNYYNMVAALYNYLIKRKIINSNPIERTDFPKVQSKVVDIYSENELNNLFEYFKVKNYDFHLYLRFLYTTAFRMNEARTLKKSQVIIDNEFREQIIIGKSKFGNKTDYFPLTKSVQDILLETPGIWDKKPDDYIFECSGVKQSTISNRFRSGMEKLNIPHKTVDYKGKGRSIHTIRKTRITNWIKAGISIHGLEKLSRDNYATVRKYYDAVENTSYVHFVD